MADAGNAPGLTALVGASVLCGGAWLDGYAVLLAEGVIFGVVPDSDVPASAAREVLRGGRLAPGYIDLQVNGGGGVLFNDSPDVATIARIGEAHRAFGTTGFLPTLLSDRLDVIARAITAVDAAIAQGVPGVLGIHIEGPFLAPERKGIHDASLFQTLTREHVALLTSLRHGKTLVTLAPERTQPELIAELVAAGVTVALGHSDATYEQACTAFACGATGVTHLFNAMSPLTSRAPGLVGAALDDPRIWCPIIVDGVHVSPVSMRIAARAKPSDRLVLVTDAMPTVGSASQSFRLGGVEISARGGICVSPDGVLAGSALDMAQAVRNAMQMLGLSSADAIAAASTNAAAFVGLGKATGTIAPGKRADLVLLDDDFAVRGTWIGGRRLDHAAPVEA